VAIIKCPECGADVSDKAPACVKCGAPIEKVDSGKAASQFPAQAPNPEAKHSFTRRRLNGLATLGFVIAAGIGLGYLINGMDTAVKSIPTGCKNDDLQCLGNAGIGGADVYCRSPIEKLAIHDVKWTDGTLENKFSRFSWATEGNRAIAYFGDKAEFQNGFGGYTPVVYECDLAPDNETVLGARIVRNGRLDSAP